MERPLDARTVRLGVITYRWLDRPVATLHLLRRYLAQSLSPEERAWAHWHVVDTLAVARRCPEAVAAQRSLLAWALDAFATDECVWVMNDGTQALCWVATGKRDDWLVIFAELMGRVAACERNRLDRFYYVRTASRLLIDAHRPGEARALIAHLRDMAGESAHWERNFDVAIEAALLELAVAQRGDDRGALRALGVQVLTLLEEKERTMDAPTTDQRRRFRSLCHNTGATLYRAQQYDLAIPVLHRAIRDGTTASHPYLWLAAALWVTTRDCAQVLPLLAQAARYRVGGTDGWTFRTVPEFRDAVDDVRFSTIFDREG